MHETLAMLHDVGQIARMKRKHHSTSRIQNWTEDVVEQSGLSHIYDNDSNNDDNVMINDDGASFTESEMLFIGKNSKRQDKEQLQRPSTRNYINSPTPPSSISSGYAYETEDEACFMNECLAPPSTPQPRRLRPNLTIKVYDNPKKSKYVIERSISSSPAPLARLMTSMSAPTTGKMTNLDAALASAFSFKTFVLSPPMMIRATSSPAVPIRKTSVHLPKSNRHRLQQKYLNSEDGRADEVKVRSNSIPSQVEVPEKSRAQSKSEVEQGSNANVEEMQSVPLIKKCVTASNKKMTRIERPKPARRPSGREASTIEKVLYAFKLALGTLSSSNDSSLQMNTSSETFTHRQKRGEMKREMKIMKRYKKSKNCKSKLLGGKPRDLTR